MFRTAFAIPFALSVIVVFALTGCSNPTEESTSKSSTPAASAKDLGATNDDQETVASGKSPPLEALHSSDLLDPSNWSLSQDSSFNRNRKTELELGELLRTKEGLQITTSSLFGEMEAKFEREFSGNFEIQMSLIHLGEDEREVAGLPRISIGHSRILFNAGQSARTHFQFLGRNEVLRNSSEIRFRTAGGRLSVSLNGKAPGIYELFDKIPFQFGLGVSSNSRVIVSKLVVTEDIPLDETLANAPITSGRGLTGMNGPLPGQEMLPPGMGPGFPPGFPPGAAIDGPPAGAMGFGPGFPPTGLPNSATILAPKQFDPFISSGPWFVPNFEQEFDKQRAERHVNMEANGPVTKISTNAPSFGFWILRRLDLPDNSSFECRLSIPSFADLTSVPIDPTTFLGTGILPANEALSQSVPNFSPLPPPLPNTSREVNLSVSRDGDQVELAINGQSKVASVPRDDSFFLGLYVQGGIKFDIEDITESTVESNVANAKPKNTSTEVVFRPLEGLQSPSRFALTEDGRYLVISHEFSHRVTIVDIFSGKEVTSINIMSPRSLLCCGGYLFVSSYNTPMINIISQKDWKDLGSRQVQQMNIVHLSAPAAPYFADEILVTCHDITNNRNEISGHTVLWNFRNGETRPIGNHAVSTISAKGDKVLVQNQFDDLTPKFGLYDFKEFASRSPLKDIESYDESLTPLQYFRSSNDGNFWISNQMIFTETPAKPIYQNASALIAEDATQPQFYTLNSTALEAHVLSDSIRSIGSRRVRFEPEIGAEVEIESYSDRISRYILDHPVACTHGDKLYLFILIPQLNQIFRCETSAFEAETDLSILAQVPLEGTEAGSASEGGSAPLSPMTSAPANPQDSLADVISRSEANVVRIEAKGDAGDGIGSGFIVDKKGTLVTNCHVLAGAKSARAIFADGKSVNIVGTLLIDERRDIVIAKVNVTDRAGIPLAGELPRKGDEVVALGTPHGLDFTATRGIVSAIRKASEIPHDPAERLEGLWIQIDAPLSPGNSGGPLINEEGKVVAMSTLASQGGAQNLNFGISAQDISQAISNSANAPAKSFADGVARLKPKQSGVTPSESSRVPDEAVRRYVESCKQNFSKQVKEIRGELERLKDTFKEMEVGRASMPSDVDRDIEVARVVTPQKQVMWFFRNTAIKGRVLEQTQQRIDRLAKVRSQVKSSKDAKSLKELALSYGPKLDARVNHEVGFVNEATVIHAFDANKAAILIDEVVFLIWLESTVGLAPGEQILPCPVYVDGTATADLPQKGSTSVTLLVQVPDSQMERVANDVVQQAAEKGNSKTETQPAPAEFRTWSDVTGKFSIEAELIRHDTETVELKRRNGTIVKLPISKLSQTDRDFLESKK